MPREILARFGIGNDAVENILGFLDARHPLAIEWQRAFRIYMNKSIYFGSPCGAIIPAEHNGSTLLDIDAAVRDAFVDNHEIIEFEDSSSGKIGPQRVLERKIRKARLP